MMFLKNKKVIINSVIIYRKMESFVYKTIGHTQ